MGGVCLNSGIFIKNKESDGFVGELGQGKRERVENYKNLSDAKTRSNSSNSRKGSFSEEGILSLGSSGGGSERKDGRPITMKQLSKHNSNSSAWTSYKGVVYDVTKYLKVHPGGMKKLLRGCGKECDLLIEIYHRNMKVDQLLKNNKIGYLVKQEQAEGKQVNKAP